MTRNAQCTNIVEFYIVAYIAELKEFKVLNHQLDTEKVDISDYPIKKIDKRTFRGKILLLTNMLKNDYTVTDEAIERLNKFVEELRPDYADMLTAWDADNKKYESEDRERRSQLVKQIIKC